MANYNYNFQTFVAEACREGVADSIAEIRERIGLFKTTTIVIPPRVGKSSLMRLSAIEFIETGKVGGAIILTPWVFLRDQMNKPEKIEDMVRQHKMDNAPLRVPLIKCDAPNRIDHLLFMAEPRPHWVTLTMGLALQQITRQVLIEIALQFQAEHRPLLVFIDECQMTSSGPDGWGKIAKDLQDAGAHIVLVTGTPERSDNTAPFGFEVVERDRETDDKFSVLRKEGDLKFVDTYTSDRVCYELKANQKLPLSEAFRHRYLCELAPRDFKFKIDGKDSTEVSDTVARRGLAAALRDPETVTVAVCMLLEELVLLRRSVPEVVAIVFVGNDRPEDGPDNKDFECRQVRRIIQKHWKNYLPGTPNIRIATLGDDAGKSAKKTIESFCDEGPSFGDIIIVKNMGGVGLDLGRLKVSLFLSTTLAFSVFAQRLLRIATPYKDMRYGTCILPAIDLTKELFRNIIEANGGQYVRENVELINTKPVKPDSDPPEPIVISEPERFGSTDMELRRVEGALDLQVDAIFSRTPWLAIRLTRREVADLIEAGSFNFSQQPPKPESQTHVLDKATKAQKHYDTINKHCTTLANCEAQYEGSNSPGSEAWVEARRRWMSRAKTHGGIQCELTMCRDLIKLAQAETFLERYVQSDDSARSAL